MKTLVRMKFGSHLYGTNTPESDTDYKGVFLPTAHQILTCRVPKIQVISKGNGDRKKNTSDDVDEELYSLPYFLKMALSGETVALDMLHAPKSAILETDDLWWSVLQANRKRFYTKNLKAFVGYARKQAAKYGIKGSRLDAVREALCILMQHPKKKIEEIFEGLPETEHSKKLLAAINHNQTEVCWEVCGKKMMGKTICEHYIPMMQKFYMNYGQRAQMAANNEGIDWKAVSHAFRAGYQARRIFTEGNFSYPLPETNYIMEVKQGLLDYQTDVAPRLDELMDELEECAEHSNLPEKPDERWVKDFLHLVNQETVFRRAYAPINY